jgi:protein-S-isoprenylcysteine O-methyltransferase Ste14
MEEENKIENIETIDPGMIHFSLSLSYLMFLFAVVAGIIVDLIIPIKINSNQSFIYIGFVLIVLSSILVYWAQFTSRRPKNYQVRERTIADFMRGPYKYTRTPTHFGIFIMTLGLGLILVSPFSVLFTFLAHVISKVVFIKKEEELLEKRYGQVFLEYKRHVKNWL